MDGLCDADISINSTTSVSTPFYALWQSERRYLCAVVETVGTAALPTERHGFYYCQVSLFVSVIGGEREVETCERTSRAVV